MEVVNPTDGSFAKDDTETSAQNRSIKINVDGLQSDHSNDEAETMCEQETAAVEPLLGMTNSSKSLHAENGLHQEMLQVSGTCDAGTARDSGQPVFPIHSINYLSMMTFHWITGYMWRVYKKRTVTDDDIWKLCPEESTEINGRRLQCLWNEEVNRKGLRGASLNRVLLSFCSRHLLVAICVNIVNAVFTFVGPAILFRGVLTYAKSTDSNIVFGLVLAGLMFLSDVGRVLSLAMQMHLGFLIATRARTALMYLVYKKILKLRSLKDKSVGEFVNYFANDCQRLHEVLVILPMTFSGPLMAVASTIYCVLYLGRWALLGAAVIAMYYPYQFVISRLSAWIRRQAISVTDKRVRLMTEILVCIRLIKLYAWETSFAKAVNAIRTKEKSLLQRAAFLQTMSSAFTPLVAVYAGVCTFLGHVLSGNELSVEQAFVCIAVYNATRLKLSLLPYVIRTGAETIVGLRRAKIILMMEEVDESLFSGKPTDDHIAIEVCNGQFAWDSVKGTEGQNSSDGSKRHQTTNNRQTSNSGHQANGVQTTTATDENEKLNFKTECEDDGIDVLFNINLTVPKGKLYGVCGSVGSGKSSLMSAILGQMIRRSGTVAVDGQLCYVPQQAWILNATLRENILFGIPFDKEKYDGVIDQCCLKPDIKMLPAGDATEIGERGVTLSGGQKQRVSLARAIYSDSDILLLDDPLSAVDTHVGQHLFEHCLLQASHVHNKTVILATHQIQYLNQCDAVAVMKDGFIIEIGTHDQLMSLNGDYAALVNTFYAQQQHNQEKDDEDEDDENFTLTTKANGSRGIGSQLSLQRCPSVAGKLIEDERVEKGAVTWNTYWSYVRNAGGIAVAIVVMLIFVLPVACASFTDWWLSQWLTQNSSSSVSTTYNVTIVDITEHRGNQFYAVIYAAVALSIIASLCLRGLVFMLVTLRASSRMHDKVFRKILRSPMSFFDVTPVGRLLNGFSKDMDEVDVRLPMNCEEFLQNICLVLSAVVMIVIGFPWFLLVLVPPLIVFLLLRQIARVVMRETKRLENVSRSPIFVHVTTTVQGLHSIRACNKEADFISKFKTEVDRNATANLHFLFAVRWLSVRLDCLTIFITFVVAVVIVTAKSHIAPSYAALALTYSAKLTALFQYTIRLVSELEARFTSVERINYYLTNIDEEAPDEIPNRQPRSTWPEDGAIGYDNYSMRYRQTLPLVLRGISCKIGARQKVGVVGRTGSGKTSLVSALFRLTEAASGSITIDDVDISTIGLHDLRSKLAIIPQDPVLFVGSIRYNLDPFDERTDSDIWQALDKCHVKERIMNMEGGLSAPVVENGENFSVGERQLLCLARALLRRSKIIVMDEATAAVDTETDAAIQETIRESFADCTLLIIAHRLNTVVQCDRILVLAQGQVAEFDSPDRLLLNPNSLFANMLRRSEVKKSNREQSPT